MEKDKLTTIQRLETNPVPKVMNCHWGECVGYIKWEFENFDKGFGSIIAKRLLWLKKQDAIDVWGVEEGLFYCSKHWAEIMDTVVRHRKTDKGLIDLVHSELSQIHRDMIENDDNVKKRKIKK